MVVRPSRNDGGKGDYRIPSTVCVHDGRLWFGSQAEARAGEKDVSLFRSLKMLVARPDDFLGERGALPEGLEVEHLGALMIWYLSQLAEKSAGRYLKHLGVGAEPDLSFTLGAPMDEVDDSEMRRRYIGMILLMRELRRQRDLLLVEGIPVNAAAQLLRSASESLPDPESLGDQRDFLRSEAEAALMWAFRSPAVPSGLYALIDVGAGTTSASWFNIVDVAATVGADTRRSSMLVKDHLSFYGASCAAPGGDAIDHVFLEVITRLHSLGEVRGREAQLYDRAGRLQRAALDRALTGPIDRIAGVHGAANTKAWATYRSSNAFRSAGMFLFGGGSRFGPVREAIAERQRKWLKGPALREMPHEMPDDLFEEDCSVVKDDATFLLVAYGLANKYGDVPDVFQPSAVPPLVPTVRVVDRPSHEEKYGR